jgi:hypothetical protein
MRKSMFRGLLLIATTAAAAALTVPAAIPAAAATATQSPGHETSGPASPTLSGMRAVPVPGKQAAVHALSLPNGWKFDSSIILENVDYSDAMTIQTSDSDGKLTNHLYMWNFYGNTTQYWDAYQYLTSDNYLFVSEYNGLCINVPGVSTQSTQLIVYSCAGQSGGPGGEPKNEVFNEYVGNDGGAVLELSYDHNMAVGIGSGFPSNGPWVITYPTNYSNYEENWAQ